MSTGNPKVPGLTIMLALAALAVTSCGSSDHAEAPPPPKPALSASTASQLASISDRVASDLDAGDLCGAAHRADELSAAIEDSDLPASLRPEVEAAATRLVDSVNCPPPPEPEPQKEKDKPKKGGQRGAHGQGEGYGDANLPWPGGHVPPGQAKKLKEGP